jgi:type I restriction enzyme M protein
VATNILFFEKLNHHATDDFATREVWYYEHRLPEGQKSYSKTKPIQVKELDPIKKWWNHRTESEIAWKVDIKTLMDRGYDLDIKNPHRQEETHEYTSTELMEKLEASFERSRALLAQLKEAVQ